MLYYAKFIGLGLRAQVPSGTYIDFATAPDDAIANLTFNSDGTCSVSAGVSPSSPANWKTGGGAGENYWVRWTIVSGTLSTGTAGVWHSLTSNVTFGRNRTGPAGETSASGTVEIATDSGGINIIATGSITLTAIVE